MAYALVAVAVVISLACLAAAHYVALTWFLDRYQRRQKPPPPTCTADRIAALEADLICPRCNQFHPIDSRCQCPTRGRKCLLPGEAVINRSRLQDLVDAFGVTTRDACEGAEAAAASAKAAADTIADLQAGIAATRARLAALNPKDPQ